MVLLIVKFCRHSLKILAFLSLLNSILGQFDSYSAGIKGIWDELFLSSVADIVSNWLHGRKQAICVPLYLCAISQDSLGDSQSQALFLTLTP